MAAEYETFEAADAGASMTFRMDAGSLKVGGYICVSGHACKITEIDISNPGKHGHAKAAIRAVDVFNGKLRTDSSPTSHCVPVPFVSSQHYTLLDIGRGGEMSLMDAEGSTRQDLNLPEDPVLRARLAELFRAGKSLELRVLKAMGQEKVMSFKEECGK
jgi:translation initiation factor 5A